MSTGTSQTLHMISQISHLPHYCPPLVTVRTFSAGTVRGFICSSVDDRLTFLPIRIFDRKFEKNRRFGKLRSVGFKVGRFSDIGRLVLGSVGRFKVRSGRFKVRLVVSSVGFKFNRFFG